MRLELSDQGGEREERPEGACRSFRALWSTLKALASALSERRTMEGCTQRSFHALVSVEKIIMITYN